MSFPILFGGNLPGAYEVPRRNTSLSGSAGLALAASNVENRSCDKSRYQKQEDAHTYGEPEFRKSLVFW